MVKLIRYIFCIWAVLLIVGFVIFINKNRLHKDIELKNGISTNETEEYINYVYEYGYYTPEYIEKKFGVKNLTNEEYERMLYYDKHIYEMLLKMTEKGNDWRCFPILKSIKERYNEKEGILEKYNFDSVEYSQETLDLLAENGSTSPICFIITKGKKKTKIYFRILLDGGLDELEEERVVDITDEHGNELDTRLVCNEQNWLIILHNFVSKDVEEQLTIAITDKLRKKYLNFQDIFSDIIPTHKNYGKVLYSIETEEQSNYNTLTAIYRCFEIKNNKNMRLYKVHFILDDKQYIDDVEIEVLE